ncbi:MAG: hypothetical protein M3O36_17390 [Myxococcota bacterium]|nr:hypothetical protein [Myxococcota bacterium]
MGTAAARSEVGGPATGEIIERPPSGLARGKWEAPPSLFHAVLLLAVVLGLLAVIAWIVAPLRWRYARHRPRRMR